MNLKISSMNCVIFMLMCIFLRISTGSPLPEIEETSNFTRNILDEKEPVDLGVDVSDDDAPKNLRLALANATLSNDTSLNQYSASIGIPRFVKAVAKMYSNLINRELIPNENVVATVGATEALHSALLGLSNPGDEWILIEPFWSKYVPMIEVVRAVPRFTSLKLANKTGQLIGADWALDKDELEGLFNNKTRGILFNNPNNPTGKMYTLEELQFIADLAERWNVTVIADEAHEWIVYEPYRIIRFATLPKMFDRTITIGSGSKTFTVAGWRIGWAYGPTHLISRLAYIHDFAVQSTATPQQDAIAYAFEEEYRNFGKPESFIATNVRETTEKRNFLVKAFNDAGMSPIVPNGGYCMLVSYPKMSRGLINLDSEVGNGKGEKFANWVIKNVGLFGFSVSDYYCKQNSYLGDKYIRFCFQKKESTIRRAVENLQNFRKKFSSN